MQCALKFQIYSCECIVTSFYRYMCIHVINNITQIAYLMIVIVLNEYAICLWLVPLPVLVPLGHSNPHHKA